MIESDMVKVDNDWHLDKRFPISLIVAILIQTIGIVWFASALNSRVGVLEDSMIRRVELPDRMTRVEVELIGLKETLVDIKELLQLNLTETRSRMNSLERLHTGPK